MIQLTFAPPPERDPSFNLRMRQFVEAVVSFFKGFKRDGAALTLAADTTVDGDLSVTGSIDAVSLGSGTTEAIQDMIASFMAAGTNITLTYNDGTNTLTIAVASAPTFAGVVTASAGVLFTGGAFAAGKAYTDGGEGLVLGCKTGSARDFSVFTPGGSTRVCSVPTGTNSMKFEGQTGFNNTNPIAKPSVTGSRGGNAALASLLTALANYGLITDSSTA